MEIMSLTPEQIAELDLHGAMRIIEQNVNNLITVNKQIIEATAVYGEARIKLDLLKNTQKTLIEINRSLKTVVNAG